MPGKHPVKVIYEDNTEETLTSKTEFCNKFHFSNGNFGQTVTRGFLPQRLRLYGVKEIVVEEKVLNYLNPKYNTPIIKKQEENNIEQTDLS